MHYNSLMSFLPVYPGNCSRGDSFCSLCSVSLQSRFHLSEIISTSLSLHSTSSSLCSSPYPCSFFNPSSQCTILPGTGQRADRFWNLSSKEKQGRQRRNSKKASPHCAWSWIWGNSPIHCTLCTLYTLLYLSDHAFMYSLTFLYLLCCPSRLSHHRLPSVIHSKSNQVSTTTQTQTRSNYLRSPSSGSGGDWI